MQRDSQTRTPPSAARLVAAIALSALLHLLLIGVWSLRQNAEDTQSNPTNPPESAVVITPAQQLSPKLPEESAKPRRREIPMIFVETDSSQPSAPPPDTKFYGKQDTVAANPKIDPNQPLGETPLVEGKQDKIPSVTDVPLESSRPSPPPAPQPAPPTPQVQAQKPAETKPEIQKPVEPSPTSEEKKPSVEQPKLAEGQIIIPAPAPTLSPPKTENRKPSEPAPPAPPQQQVAAVNQQPQPPSPARPAPPTQRQIPARATKLDQSSTQRRGNVSLNVKGTPFGAYDERLIASVSRRWHLMLQDKVFGDRPGTVVISFILKDDGSIENARIDEETVGAVLATACLAAIQNSAPFDPFTDEMRAMLGGKHRECKFVFYY